MKKVKEGRRERERRKKLIKVDIRVEINFLLFHKKVGFQAL